MGLFSKKPKETLDFDERGSYVIAGINKYGLSARDCGTYRGWVFRDKENRYDKNAVAVFKNETHIGYLHKEIAKDLAGKVDQLGGRAPAIVRIERKYDDYNHYYYFFGRVQILWPDTE